MNKVRLVSDGFSHRLEVQVSADSWAPLYGVKSVEVMDLVAGSVTELIVSFALPEIHLVAEKPRVHVEEAQLDAIQALGYEIKKISE